MWCFKYSLEFVFNLINDKIKHYQSENDETLPL